jgi:hypothetical protein
MVCRSKAGYQLGRLHAATAARVTLGRVGAASIRRYSAGWESMAATHRDELELSALELKERLIESLRATGVVDEMKVRVVARSSTPVASEARAARRAVAPPV